MLFSACHSSFRFEFGRGVRLFSLSSLWTSFLEEPSAVAQAVAQRASFSVHRGDLVHHYQPAFSEPPYRLRSLANCMACVAVGLAGVWLGLLARYGVFPCSSATL